MKPEETGQNPKKVGRPSAYSADLADAICERLIDGESLRHICERQEFPARSTVLRWLAENADFAAKCARARELQADLMDDRILETAEACNETNYQSAKVKISAYQWRASKLQPKKYGDRVDLEHSGEIAIKRVVTDL